MTPRALLTIRQATEILQVSLKTVRRRIKAGELPVIRDGNIVRIDPDDLSAYIAARRESHNSGAKTPEK